MTCPQIDPVVGGLAANTVKALPAKMWHKVMAAGAHAQHRYKNRPGSCFNGVHIGPFANRPFLHICGDFFLFFYFWSGSKK